MSDTMSRILVAAVVFGFLLAMKLEHEKTTNELPVVSLPAEKVQPLK